MLFRLFSWLSLPLPFFFRRLGTLLQILCKMSRARKKREREEEKGREGLNNGERREGYKTLVMGR